MGILGLLQYLKGCLKQKRLSQYRGKRVAVDSYAWLHKIIKGPSGRQLVLGGQNRYKYVDDCIKRIRKLKNLGIDVIMVFDGGPLPCKQQQQQQRRKQQKFTQALKLIEKGDEGGFKKLVDSIDVSPDIAYRLIVELKKQNIQFIVAPYQADAQLAYLSRQNIVDYIITEDSDLLAFGAKRILYKIDFINMTASQLQLDHLKHNKEVNFTWFTHGMFLTTCILAGCDYLTSISGVGFKTAHKLIGRVTTFQGFIGQISSQGKSIPFDYKISFMKAFLTFRFQRVYCPRQRKCVQLNDMKYLQVTKQQLLQQQKRQIPWSQQVLTLQLLSYLSQQNQSFNFGFLGQKYSESTMRNIAQGIINPISFNSYDTSDTTYPINVKQYVQNHNIIQNAITNIANRPLGKSNYHQGQKKYSQQAQTMSQFLKKGNQKIKPSSLTFKSIKNNKQQIIYPSTQNNITEVNQSFKPIKSGLRFCSDQQQQSDKQNSAKLSYLQSSVQQIQEMQVLAFNKTKSSKDQFQLIAQQFFSPMFSEEFLKNPFSL